MHRDTPDNTGKTPDQEPQRLNNKLGLAAVFAAGLVVGFRVRRLRW